MNANPSRELLNYAAGDRAFAAWLARVDQILLREIGAGVLDADDYAWRVQYDAGVEPMDATGDFVAGR